MDALNELIEFLQVKQRNDVKLLALQHLLSLTGTAEGKLAILENDSLLSALLYLTKDVAVVKVAKEALSTLINLTGEAVGAEKCYRITCNQPTFNIVASAVESIIDVKSEVADQWSMLLSNLSRLESLVDDILHDLQQIPNAINNMITAFTTIDYNCKKANLNYLAQVFCNLSQTAKGRELLTDKNGFLLDKLITFTTYEPSVIRRGGIIGLIKNLCFDIIYHEILLHQNDDILCAILYPLCGPEEFDDDDNEILPIELQYLPETKERETDASLRKMLLESLLQLCATKTNRQHLRSKGVYPILRAYHKWEGCISRDRECLLVCENVVDILIKNEDEIACENYKHIELTESMTKDFIQQDEDYLKTLF